MRIIKIFIISYIIIILFLLYNDFSFKKVEIKDKLSLSNEIFKIYTTLYDVVRSGYFRPRFIGAKNLKTINTQNRKVCICSICKNENLYIKEFIEYYLNIGIAKIVIYDNNDINGEIINENIKTQYSKKVDIIDIRGMSSIQIPISNYCYKKNSNYYGWIGIVDVDEYLFIKNNEKVDSFLSNSRFTNCELVLLNWIIYNDNGLIKYDNRTLNERFNNPKVQLPRGKSFIRGGNNNLLIPSTHIPGINAFHFCNSNGKKIYPKTFLDNDKEISPLAYIKHFYTKTAEEFCKKLYRGDAHYPKNHPNYHKIIKSKINLFFHYNELTKQKIKILEKCTNLNLIYYRKLLKI